jgi:ribose transport system substrate-binding protein
MKQISFLYLLAVVVTLSLMGGCSRAEINEHDLLVSAEASTVEASNPAASTETPVTVALVMKTLTNPFFVEMEKGAREAEAELGINLVVKTGAQETSIEQQIAIIKGLIEDNVDAIIIAPADSTELIPVLKEAQDTGIAIINIDNQLDPEVSQQIGLQNVPFISVNNEHGAYLSAQHISNQIEQPTQVALLEVEGIRTARNAQERKRGALRAFAENSNIQVVAVDTAHWKIDEAYDVAGQMFTRHPNIGAVFCANDMMALGVLQYLEDTERTDVLVAAYDALEEAQKALRAGKLQATIDQQAAQQGYMGVQFAMRALAGEQLPPETLIDVKLVTAENVDE